MKEVFMQEREAESQRSAYLDDAYHYENWKHGQQKESQTIKTKNNEQHRSKR